MGPLRWLSYITGVRNRAEQRNRDFHTIIFLCFGVSSKYTDCEGDMEYGL